MFVFTAGVVGAGTMGAEIAAVIAAAGIPVVLCDADEGALDRGLEKARAVIARGVEKAGLEPAAAAALLEERTALLRRGEGYSGLGAVDLAIEAVPEAIALKLEVFAALDAATPGHAILATNTSALSVSELATATTRPERVLGLHFFNPASVMRLVEIVEGDDTAPEALAAAGTFVAALRKTAIRCADAPGFVVNRVLAAATGEVMRAQEEDGLAIAAVDRAIVDAKAAPMGPFALFDLVGLDTALAVADHLHEAYGERFPVHQGMRELVARGELGAKTGRGFYERGEPRAAGGADPDAAELAERFRLRALVEACLLVEDGVAGVRDVDAALAAGAGMAGPFAAADAAGLDAVLERLRRAERDWGEGFAPPVLLRRLVAGGRTGAPAAQGFFPAPRPDAGQDGPVRLESRGEVAIAWLDSPPANSITPAVIDGLRAAFDAAAAPDGPVRALVIASANPALFCAGADIRAMAAMDAAEADAFTGRMHELLLDFERSHIAVVAAVGGLAYGGGCELAMGADVRIAARSASFGQPEIKLGLMPGFGGTQRLPRLVGLAKALEMNLTGEPIDADDAWQHGLVHRVVPDHELLDSALAWARRLAAQPARAVEQIKRATNGADLEAGARLERAAFAEVIASADAREGIAAFVEKRAPRFGGA